jgi:hypothetical protein
MLMIGPLYPTISRQSTRSTMTYLMIGTQSKLSPVRLPRLHYAMPASRSTTSRPSLGLRQLRPAIWLRPGHPCGGSDHHAGGELSGDAQGLERASAGPHRTQCESKWQLSEARRWLPPGSTRFLIAIPAGTIAFLPDSYLCIEDALCEPEPAGHRPDHPPGAHPPRARRGG